MRDEIQYNRVNRRFVKERTVCRTDEKFGKDQTDCIVVGLNRCMGLFVFRIIKYNFNMNASCGNNSSLKLISIFYFLYHFG